MPNRIEQLEQQLADLETILAEGGQYIPDYYDCVVWEPLSDFHKNLIKHRIDKIYKELIQLYKPEPESCTKLLIPLNLNFLSISLALNLTPAE